MITNLVLAFLSGATALDIWVPDTGSYLIRDGWVTNETLFVPYGVDQFELEASASVEWAVSSDTLDLESLV